MNLHSAAVFQASIYQEFILTTPEFSLNEITEAHISKELENFKVLLHVKTKHIPLSHLGLYSKWYNAHDLH